MSESLQHLVLVRHGESEGDVRRAAWKSGQEAQASKLPEDEELTSRGAEQSRKAGLWIIKNILQKHNPSAFDGYFVSTALRSLQSAVAMDLEGAVWQADSRLDERNRGRIRGLHSKTHEQLFPDSFQQMKSDPLHWVPPGPGGEAILPHLVGKFHSFYDDIQDMESAIVVGHRDEMWAAMQPLECLSDDELLAVNTNDIHNAQIIQYTSLDPATGEQAPRLLWKRSVNPISPTVQTPWQYLSQAAILYSARS